MDMQLKTNMPGFLQFKVAAGFGQQRRVIHGKPLLPLTYICSNPLGKT